MKRIIMLTILLFILVGCSTPIEYETASNIRIEDEIIKWDAVEDAISYEVTLNETLYTLSIPSYDISELINGSYTVRITIIYPEGYKKSIDYDFDISRLYQSPTDLLVDDYILSFTSTIPTTYELYINDILKTSFEETSIDISDYVVLNQDSNIKVNAIYESQDYMSDVYIFDGLIHLDMNQSLTYELRSSETIIVNFDQLDDLMYIKIDDEILADTLYSYTSTSITFDKDIFFYPSYGLNTYEVYTASGYFMITINVIETENPHLLSPNVLTYISLEDIELEFNLLGGTFAQLSGYLLETSDYTFEDGTLTIYASYIESILAENPDRENIAFSYQLQKNGNSYIGIIFIYL
ncbi:hypothetical protein [Mariniplasma anaerobium]|uniref:Uncharacterized protein n=1 Tax=Mariniplasma anaerobium TaxID=2735436 RepID=A0A7U9TIV3_9MOLU|nr:hypothetical protein [Mariniplasma anaerobium]BCR35462.1 hypothetical protein MPAN_003550 [Mariniplasma anaerobium]